MSKMYLKQPGFKHSECELFTKKEKNNTRNYGNRGFKKYLLKRTRQSIF